MPIAPAARAFEPHVSLPWGFRARVVSPAHQANEKVHRSMVSACPKIPASVMLM